MGKLNQISKQEKLPCEIQFYGNMLGQDGMRNALAKYMTNYWFGGNFVDPDYVIM